MGPSIGRPGDRGSVVIVVMQTILVIVVMLIIVVIAVMQIYNITSNSDNNNDINAVVGGSVYWQAGRRSRSILDSFVGWDGFHANTFLSHSCSFQMGWVLFENRFFQTSCNFQMGSIPFEQFFCF